uniref:Uncharacterized protein n=1 Tax=Rhizophora mucronata TaxID=61149 RepID=A0A2P2P2X5_RHIMU
MFEVKLNLCFMHHKKVQFCRDNGTYEMLSNLLLNLPIFAILIGQVRQE